MKKILLTLFAVSGLLIVGFCLTDNLLIRGAIWLSVCLFLMSWASRKYKQYRLTTEITKLKKATHQSTAGIRGNIYEPLNYFSGSKLITFDRDGSVTGRVLTANIKFPDL
jgi:hypothetical protein